MLIKYEQKWWSMHNIKNVSFLLYNLNKIINLYYLASLSIEHSDTPSLDVILTNQFRASRSKLQTLELGEKIISASGNDQMLI